MRYLLLAAFGVACVGLLRWQRQRRSWIAFESWLRDQDRQIWAQGIDQSCIRWPIDKRVNELGWRNRYTLRTEKERRRA